jgi:hypothetical protein
MTLNQTICCVVVGALTLSVRQLTFCGVCAAAQDDTAENMQPTEVFHDSGEPPVFDDTLLEAGVKQIGHSFIDDEDAEGIATDPPSRTPPDPDALPSIAPRFFFQGTGAAGFAGPGGLGGAGGGGALGPRGDYQTAWLPTQDVSGQNAHLGFVQQNLSLSTPVWRGDGQGITASLYLRSEIFDTNVILPDSRMAFPNELWNVRFGGGYFYKFDNGWTAGINVQLGSASDEPFSNLDVITETVSAFLRVPYHETGTWLFSLNYSNNGQISKIPIPGVAYFYKPSPDFQAAIGFPFASVVYRPKERLTLEASYALVTTIRTRVSYEITENSQLYAGYDWLNESYLLADRADSSDRFYYYEQRLAVGWQRKLADHVGIDLSSGYAFDRRYFTNDTGFSLTGTDLVKVGNTPFVALRIHVRF